MPAVSSSAERLPKNRTSAWDLQADAEARQQEALEQSPKQAGWELACRDASTNAATASAESRKTAENSLSPTGGNGLCRPESNIILKISKDRKSLAIFLGHLTVWLQKFSCIISAFKKGTCTLEFPPFHGGITGSNPVGAARPTVERLTDDNVIEHVDLQNPGSFGQPESQPDTARAELAASDPDLKAAALVQGVRRRFVVLDCLSRARVRL